MSKIQDRDNAHVTRVQAYSLSLLIITQNVSSALRVLIQCVYTWRLVHVQLYTHSTSTAYPTNPVTTSGDRPTRPADAPSPYYSTPPTDDARPPSPESSAGLVGSGVGERASRASSLALMHCTT